MSSKNARRMRRVRRSRQHQLQAETLEPRLLLSVNPALGLLNLDELLNPDPLSRSQEVDAVAVIKQGLIDFQDDTLDRLKDAQVVGQRLPIIGDTLASLPVDSVLDVLADNGIFTGINDLGELRMSLGAQIDSELELLESDIDNTDGEVSFTVKFTSVFDFDAEVGATAKLDLDLSEIGGLAQDLDIQASLDGLLVKLELTITFGVANDQFFIETDKSAAPELTITLDGDPDGADGLPGTEDDGTASVNFAATTGSRFGFLDIGVQNGEVSFTDSDGNNRVTLDVNLHDPGMTPDGRLIGAEFDSDLSMLATTEVHGAAGAKLPLIFALPGADPAAGEDQPELEIDWKNVATADEFEVVLKNPLAFDLFDFNTISAAQVHAGLTSVGSWLGSALALSAEENPVYGMEIPYLNSTLGEFLAENGASPLSLLTENLLGDAGAGNAIQSSENISDLVTAFQILAPTNATIALNSVSLVVNPVALALGAVTWVEGEPGKTFVVTRVGSGVDFTTKLSEGDRVEYAISATDSGHGKVSNVTLNTFTVTYEDGDAPTTASLTFKKVEAEVLFDMTFQAIKVLFDTDDLTTDIGALDFSFDEAIPGLSVEGMADAEVTVTLDVNLTFGLALGSGGDGDFGQRFFVIDNALDGTDADGDGVVSLVEKYEVVLTLDVVVPDLAVTGTIGLLDVKLSEALDTDDAVDMSISFLIDLTDPGSGDAADHHIRLDEFIAAGRPAESMTPASRAAQANPTILDVFVPGLSAGLLIPKLTLGAFFSGVELPGGGLSFEVDDSLREFAVDLDLGTFTLVVDEPGKTFVVTRDTGSEIDFTTKLSNGDQVEYDNSAGVSATGTVSEDVLAGSFTVTYEGENAPDAGDPPSFKKLESGNPTDHLTVETSLADLDFNQLREDFQGAVDGTVDDFLAGVKSGEFGENLTITPAMIIQGLMLATEQLSALASEGAFDGIQLPLINRNLGDIINIGDEIFDKLFGGDSVVSEDSTTSLDGLADELNAVLGGGARVEIRPGFGADAPDGTQGPLESYLIDLRVGGQIIKSVPLDFSFDSGLAPVPGLDSLISLQSDGALTFLAGFEARVVLGVDLTVNLVPQGGTRILVDSNLAIVTTDPNDDTKFNVKVDANSGIDFTTSLVDGDEINYTDQNDQTITARVANVSAGTPGTPPVGSNFDVIYPELDRVVVTGTLDGLAVTNTSDDVVDSFKVELPLRNPFNFTEEGANQVKVGDTIGYTDVTGTSATARVTNVTLEMPAAGGGAATPSSFEADILNGGQPKVTIPAMPDAVPPTDEVPGTSFRVVVGSPTPKMTAGANATDFREHNFNFDEILKDLFFLDTAESKITVTGIATAGFDRILVDSGASGVTFVPIPGVDPGDPDLGFTITVPGVDFKNFGLNQLVPDVDLLTYETATGTTTAVVTNVQDHSFDIMGSEAPKLTTAADPKLDTHFTQPIDMVLVDGALEAASIENLVEDIPDDDERNPNSLPDGYADGFTVTLPTSRILSDNLSLLDSSDGTVPLADELHLFDDFDSQGVLTALPQSDGFTVMWNPPNPVITGVPPDMVDFTGPGLRHLEVGDTVLYSPDSSTDLTDPMQLVEGTVANVQPNRFDVLYERTTDDAGKDTPDIKTPDEMTAISRPLALDLDFTDGVGGIENGDEISYEDEDGSIQSVQVSNVQATSFDVLYEPKLEQLVLGGVMLMDNQDGSFTVTRMDPKPRTSTPINFEDLLDVDDKITFLVSDMMTPPTDVRVVGTVSMVTDNSFTVINYGDNAPDENNVPAFDKILPPNRPSATTDFLKPLTSQGINFETSIGPFGVELVNGRALLEGEFTVQLADDRILVTHGQVNDPVINGDEFTVNLATSTTFSFTAEGEHHLEVGDKIQYGPVNDPVTAMVTAVTASSFTAKKDLATSASPNSATDFSFDFDGKMTLNDISDLRQASNSTTNLLKNLIRGGQPTIAGTVQAHLPIRGDLDTGLSQDLVDKLPNLPGGLPDLSLEMIVEVGGDLEAAIKAAKDPKGSDGVFGPNPLMGGINDDGIRFVPYFGDLAEGATDLLFTHVADPPDIGLIEDNIPLAASDLMAQIGGSDNHVLVVAHTPVNFSAELNLQFIIDRLGDLAGWLANLTGPDGFGIDLPLIGDVLGAFPISATFEKIDLALEGIDLTRGLEEFEFEIASRLEILSRDLKLTTPDVFDKFLPDIVQDWGLRFRAELLDGTDYSDVPVAKLEAGLTATQDWCRDHPNDHDGDSDCKVDAAVEPDLAVFNQSLPKPEIRLPIKLTFGLDGNTNDMDPFSPIELNFDLGLPDELPQELLELFDFELDGTVELIAGIDIVIVPALNLTDGFFIVTDPNLDGVGGDDLGANSMIRNISGGPMLAEVMVSAIAQLTDLDAGAKFILLDVTVDELPAVPGANVGSAVVNHVPNDDTLLDTLTVTFTDPILTNNASTGPLTSGEHELTNLVAGNVLIYRTEQNGEVFRATVDVDGAFPSSFILKDFKDSNGDPLDAQSAEVLMAVDPVDGADGDFFAPKNNAVSANFIVDIKNPSLPDAGNRLTISDLLSDEFQGSVDSLIIDFDIEADVNLGLTSDIGSGDDKLPSLGASFEFAWDWELNDTEIAKPDIRVYDFTLHTGEFFSGTLFPFLQQMNKFNPIDPFRDDLNEELPLIDITVMEAIRLVNPQGTPGYTSVLLLDALLTLSQTVNSIEMMTTQAGFRADDASLKIPLEEIMGLIPSQRLELVISSRDGMVVDPNNPGGNSPVVVTGASRQTGVQPTKADAGQSDVPGAALPFIGAQLETLSDKFGLEFPLLQFENIFGLMLGQTDVSLATWRPPNLELLWGINEEIDMGAFGIPFIAEAYLKAYFNGGIKLFVDLEAGLDTRFLLGQDGINARMASGFGGEVPFFLAGFYLDDNFDEHTGFDKVDAGVNIGVSAGLDASVAILGFDIGELSGSGGINAQVGVNFNDDNINQFGEPYRADRRPDEDRFDGRFHLDEIVSVIAMNGGNPLCMFDLSGGIFAHLDIHAEVDLVVETIEKNFHDSWIIAEFEISCQEDVVPVATFVPATGVATIISGALQALNTPADEGEDFGAVVDISLVDSDGSSDTTAWWLPAWVDSDGNQIVDDQGIALADPRDTIQISAGAYIQTFGPNPERGIDVEVNFTPTLTDPAPMPLELIVGSFAHDHLGSLPNLLVVDPNIPIAIKFTGGDGNDIMTGGAGNVTLVGGGGDDTLGLPQFKFDAAGNLVGFDPAILPHLQALWGGTYPTASLSGGGDADILTGGPGNDTILGGEGDDILDGGAIVKDGEPAFLASGDDTLVGGGGDDQLDGKGGNDFLVGDYDDGSHNPTTPHPDGPPLDVPFDGRPNTAAAEGSDLIDAGDGNDTVFGDNEADSGNFVYGVNLVLDDTIYGGEGADTLHGGGGDDLIDGDPRDATDTSYADNIRGDAGNDIIEGRIGDDIIAGGLGNDLIRGGAGADFITGGQGDDDLHGNLGNDTLIGGGSVVEADGSDTIAGGDGDDILVGDNGLVNATGTNISTVFGGTNPLIVEGGHDVLRGQGGFDTILGGVGDDVMYAGDRNDPDNVVGPGLFTHIMIGDNGEITPATPTTPGLIRTTDPSAGGSDSMVGSAGKDIILGGSGGDEINGLDGADILVGDNAELTLAGNSVPAAAGQEIPKEGKRSDHGSRFQPLDVVAGINPLLSTQALLADAALITGLSPRNGDSDGESVRLQRVVGDIAEGDDIDAGNLLGNTIAINSGTDEARDGAFTISIIRTTNPMSGGNDTMVGGIGNDTMFGGFGDDSMDGGLDTDVMLGDNGEILLGRLDKQGDPIPDSIKTTDHTAGGRDAMDGGGGNDIMLGGVGDDIMFGGTEDDIMLGDNGIVTILNENPNLVTTADPNNGGNDDMHGGDGEDTMLGGTGSDVMYGNTHDSLGGNDGDASDNDVMLGDHGMVDRDDGSFTAIDTDKGAADTMFGNRGDDTMLGQFGDDEMFGDAGHDSMIGGHNVAGGTDEDGNDGVNDLMDGGTGFDVMAGDNAIILTGNNPLIVDVETDPSEWPGDAISNPNGSHDRMVTLLDHHLGAAANTQGNDRMAGGGDGDTMLGGMGDDSIHGGMWDDNWTRVNNGATDSAVNDKDDYIEGNAGDDLIYGDRGQDDLIGGSSNLFGLDSPSTSVNGDDHPGEAGELAPGDDRPDGSDEIYGGSGDEVEALSGAIGADHPHDVDHSHDEDADAILGDNGVIVRRLANGDFRNYDHNDAVIRYIQFLDHDASGELEGGDGTNIGASDTIHGEAGDDTIRGQTGGDVLFGDAQDDDLFGDAGGDFIHGGTGSDGILGDDGVLESRINDNAEEELSTPGNRLVYTAYPDDALYKEATLVDADLGGDDTIFGGQGNDSIHGGAGNDAISGAEPRAYVDPESPPAWNLDMFLPDSPLDKIAGHLLNFDHETRDGLDVLFGNAGDDWLVGGTESDQMFGGAGDDILNADDNLETSGVDGEEPDNSSDTAFGGGGRDTLLGNTGRDRLIDWAGSFNLFAVPHALYGGFTITRSPAPHIRQFLLDLADALGEDRTESIDEINIIEPGDSDWTDNTGAPPDGHPGNTPGVRSDVNPG